MASTATPTRGRDVRVGDTIRSRTPENIHRVTVVEFDDADDLGPLFRRVAMRNEASGDTYRASIGIAAVYKVEGGDA